LPFVVLIMADLLLFQPAALLAASSPGRFLLAVVAIHLAFLLRSCFRP